MRKSMRMVYTLGNRRKRLLTDAFLQTLKDELDRIFKTSEQVEPPTYWNDYLWMEGTIGFSEALKIASEQHQVFHAIYEYSSRLSWWEWDSFAGIVTDLMVERKIIAEGSLDSQQNEDYLRELEKSGEIVWFEDVVYHKGYHVTTRDWRFV